jgi:hypothetical protein
MAAFQVRWKTARKRLSVSKGTERQLQVVDHEAVDSSKRFQAERNRDLQLYGRGLAYRNAFGHDRRQQSNAAAVTIDDVTDTLCPVTVPQQKKSSPGRAANRSHAVRHRRTADHEPNDRHVV